MFVDFDWREKREWELCKFILIEILSISLLWSREDKREREKLGYDYVELKGDVVKVMIGEM